MGLQEEYLTTQESSEDYLVIDINKEEDDHLDAIQKVSQWFIDDEEAHQFYTDEMNEMYKLWNGDHWNLTGYGGGQLRTDQQQQTRPNAVENITFSLVEGLVSEFSVDMQIVDFPVDENDDDAATVMTDLKEFIASKNRIKTERQKFIRWFFLYGTGIWHTYWDDDWQGGRGPNRWKGDIRWTALHPNCFFPDARCRESVNDGTRVHKAIWKPIEHVKERYPNADILPDMVDATDFIGDEIDHATMEEMQDQVRVIETWYIGEPLIKDNDNQTEPGLHIIKWVEGQNKYLDHANYVNFDQGETPTFSSVFVVKQCYPREGSIFGYGEPYFFKQVQIIRNKTAELVLEGHMHQAVGQTFYQEGALTSAQQEVVKQMGTVPGWWFPVNDINGIHRQFSQGVPASLLNELDRLQRVAENTVGRFDISQGRTPGSVTAFRALDLLNSRAQVRLRSKEESIASGYEEVGANINRLIDRNYDRARSYRIIGDEDKRKWGKYDPDEHKKVYMYDTNETFKLGEFKQAHPQAFQNEFQVEGMAPVEGQDFEVYSPELDVQCQVSTKLPSDRLFYMEMAKELLANGLVDEEIFWYVMEHGKFPPFEEMKQRVQEKKQQEMMMAQQQMMMQLAQQLPPGQQPQAQLPSGQTPPKQPNMQDAVNQALQQGNPTVDDVLALMPDEAKAWYEQQPPEIQQAFIQEIELAMQGGGQ